MMKFLAFGLFFAVILPMASLADQPAMRLRGMTESQYNTMQNQLASGMTRSTDCGVGGQYDPATQSCVSNCPPGQTYSNGTCVDGGGCQAQNYNGIIGNCDAPTCAEGETYDTTDNKCVSVCGDLEVYNLVSKRCVPQDNACPAGQFYSAAQSKCIANCASGETYNIATGDCQAGTIAHCARGMVYNAESNSCGYSCPTGKHYDSTLQECVTDTPSCAAGTMYNSAQGNCITACPAGQVYDAVRQKCKLKNLLCAQGTVYDEATGICVAKCGPGQIYEAETQICRQACHGGYEFIEVPNPAANDDNYEPKTRMERRCKSYNCPSGTTLTNGICVKDLPETMDPTKWWPSIRPPVPPADEDEGEGEVPSDPPAAP